MDKLDLAQIVLKYWFLVEFLDQPNFPAGSTNQKHAKDEERKKQITLYHTFGSQEANMAHLILADTDKYPKQKILCDEGCICIGNAVLSL